MPFGVKQKILMGWELPNCSMDDGYPFVISRQFGATLFKQGILMPIIDAWRVRGLTAEEAKGLDIAKLVGKPCELLNNPHRIQQAAAVQDAVATIRSSEFLWLEIP